MKVNDQISSTTLEEKQGSIENHEVYIYNDFDEQGGLNAVDNMVKLGYE